MTARSLLRPSLSWLLVFLPLTVWAERGQPEAHVPIFLSTCLGFHLP